MSVELEPELGACIETQAKRRYEQLMGEMLGEETEAAAEELETLRVFLASADFSRLRSESERYLVAGKKVKFILRREGEGAKYEMEVG
ncbi:hypothetical protein ACFLWN_00135 [Chloroflexota bacterium]